MLTREQLETTYRSLEPKMFNFALRWVFDRARAEELVHEAFIRVWQRRDEVRLETLPALLFTALRHLALNDWRKSRVRTQFSRAWKWLNDDRDLRTAEQLLLDREAADLGRAVFERMPLDLREVLLISEYSELTQDEIARLLGIAPGTVASRRSRAKAWLRSALEGESPDAKT